MMKWILLLILVLVTGQIYCFSDYGTIFLAIEPSSINIAMGETVGVTNIWHNNPLIFYANPAIASLHEGISYGYKRDPWLQDVFACSRYSGGLISLGYRGMSITLPAYNGSKRSGIDFEVKDDFIGMRKSRMWSYYENAEVYGTALNPFEVYRTFSDSEGVSGSLDLAVGINYIRIRSEVRSKYGFDEYHIPKANFLNLGILARYEKEISDHVLFEGVAGYSRFNLTDSKIGYYESAESEPVYSHNNFGIASSFSFPAVNYDIGFINQDIFHYKNLMTYRALASYMTDPNSSSSIAGFGIEGGFLDALFIRAGRHIDKDGHREGNTYGFGINLNYKSIISFSYNYSVNRAGELVDSQKAYDLGLSIDAIRIAGL
jgi:hypothetical protein